MRRYHIILRASYVDVDSGVRQKGQGNEKKGGGDGIGWGGGLRDSGRYKTKDQGKRVIGRWGEEERGGEKTKSDILEAKDPFNGINF